MHSARTAAAVAVLCVILATAPATAQAHPDFTGTYTNASLTPLARSPANKSLVVSREEAARIVAGTPVLGFNNGGKQDAKVTVDPKTGAPSKGGSDFGTAAYNTFWVSPGESLAVVKGEYRTSGIVDPPNGQVPYKDAAAVMKSRQAGYTRYVTGIGGNAGPEDTNLAERCLLGFSQTGGPGMLSALYNNNYEFVQTKDALLIVVEMDHDARIVPIYGSEAEAKAHHKPNVIKPWLGDSVGWWEGETLAFETANVHPQQQRSGAFVMSPKGKVTERLTKDGEGIFYTFSVDDPEMYTQVWKAEYTFNPIKGHVYEYACHEGNYAMPHMLAGQRMQDEAAAKAKPVKASATGKAKAAKH
jgi:hypothetical protein